MSHANDPLASLTIRHPTSDLTGVLEQFGFVAQRVWRVGEPRVSAKGAPLPGKWDSSGASVEILFAGQSPEQVLLSLCQQLDSRIDVLHQVLKTGGSATIYMTIACGSGLVFGPRLVSSMAAVGVGIEIDAYR